MVKGVALLSIIVLAATAAGCGGGTTAKHSAATACTLTPAARRALRRIDADVAAIRRGARLPASDKLKGNAATNRATDAFLHDVEVAPLDNIRRNRLIDHAAAALVGACEQCFQALEAERPVVTIHLRHGTGCGPTAP